MPCGCAERREAIKRGWHRMVGYMSNANMVGVDRVKADKERAATEARMQAANDIKRRQQELTGRRRAF